MIHGPPSKFAPVSLRLAACLAAVFVSPVKAQAAEAVGSPPAAVVQYRPTPGAVESAAYGIAVNGQPVFVEKFKDVSYARFAFSGNVEVVIDVRAPFSSYVLSPVAPAIPVSRNGKRMVFSLSAPKMLILQCEGLEKLFLFADAPEDRPPKLGDPDVTSVLDFVQDRVGERNQRAQIQKAIDAVAAKPRGGVLYFPSGTYLTGTLVLRSNVTAYLEDGALLQGSADPGDYFVAAAEPRRTSAGKGTGALIYFADAENARLTGRGTVALQGTKIRQIVSDHPRICELVRSRNCEISGVILRDSGGFNIHMIRCENLILRGYKIINDLTLSNQDGTDPDSSKNILVDGVFMYTSDDAIAVKADVGLCEDVVVKNCVFWTKKSALKVGSDPYFGAKNITFENNDIVHADRALALYASRGFIEDVKYLDDRSESIGGDSKQQLIVFQVAALAAPGRKESAPYTGFIRNVLVDRYVALRPSPNQSVIRGSGAGHAVTNIEFRDFRLGGRPVADAKAARMDVGPHADDVRFISGADSPVGPRP